MRVDIGRQHMGHRAPCPDDRDGVGDGEYFVELVRDEQRSHALGGELAQRGEQLIDLVRHEHRGGFVEYEDLHAAIQHLQDLDPLACAYAELVDGGIRIDSQTVPTPDLENALAGPVDVDAPLLPGLVTEDDVLDDGQVAGQHEVLMHHADAGGDGVARRLERSNGAIDGDGALVRRLLAIEDLHQRRLARTVLAHDRVHRAVAHREVDVVVGDDAGEPLGDAP